MIYSLIFITATGIQSYGAYNSLPECQSAAKEFQRQEIKAGCVKQQSQEESMAKAQSMMQSFIKMIPADK